MRGQLKEAGGDPGDARRGGRGAISGEKIGFRWHSGEGKVTRLPGGPGWSAVETGTRASAGLADGREWAVAGGSGREHACAERGEAGGAGPSWVGPACQSRGGKRG